MRQVAVVYVLLVVAGCGNSGGPDGVDPVVWIDNQSSQPVLFEWRDGQSVIGRDTVFAHTRACENFFARPDSAYFYAAMLGAPRTDNYTQPWFDPSARHGWTMEVTDQTAFLVTDVGSSTPC